MTHLWWSYPDGRMLACCLTCRAVVIAVEPGDPGGDWTVLNPSTSERQWLWRSYPGEGLAFAPGTGGVKATLHECGRALGS